MKAILHIGTEKTGTTSIQSFLAMNRPALRKAGFLVPGSLGPTNHRFLPAMVTGDDYFDELFRRQKLFDPDSRRQAKADWREKFLAQLQRTQCDTVLISSEHLHSRLRTTEEVAALAEFLGPLFDQVKILVYLRDPAETACSIQSTGIKNGRQTTEMPGPQDAYVRLIVDHQATLRRWLSCFGSDALMVRLYEPASFHGGSLIADYVQACGLAELALQEPPRRNESLSAIGLEVLAHINTLIPAVLPDGRFNPDRRGLAQFFEQHFRDGPRLTLTAAQRQAFDQAYAASNDWVRQHYFPDRPQLFRASSPDQTPAPLSPLDPTAICSAAQAIASLWLQQTRAQSTGPDQDDTPDA